MIHSSTSITAKWRCCSYVSIATVDDTLRNIRFFRVELKSSQERKRQRFQLTANTLQPQILHRLLEMLPPVIAKRQCCVSGLFRQRYNTEGRERSGWMSERERERMMKNGTDPSREIECERERLKEAVMSVVDIHSLKATNVRTSGLIRCGLASVRMD